MSMSNGFNHHLPSAAAPNGAKFSRLTCEDVVHDQRHGIDVNLVLADNGSTRGFWITKIGAFKGHVTRKWTIVWMNHQKVTICNGLIQRNIYGTFTPTDRFENVSSATSSRRKINSCCTKPAHANRTCPSVCIPLPPKKTFMAGPREFECPPEQPNCSTSSK